MSSDLDKLPRALEMQYCGNCYFRRGMLCKHSIYEIDSNGYPVFPKITFNNWCGEWRSMPVDTIQLRAPTASQQQANA